MTDYMLLSRRSWVAPPIPGHAHRLMNPRDIHAHPMDRLAARAAGDPGRPIPAGLRQGSGSREGHGRSRRSRGDRGETGADRHHQRTARPPRGLPPGRGTRAGRRHRHPPPVRGGPGCSRRHRAVPDRPGAAEGRPRHQPRRPGAGRGQPRGGGRQAQALRRPGQGPRHQRTRVHRGADRRTAEPGADRLAGPSWSRPACAWATPR